jgi:CarboxypepD_reg-like domain
MVEIYLLHQNQIIMKPLLTFAFLLLSFVAISQSTLSGKIVDTKNKPVSSANIYIDGTYDGATSDEKGEFSFTTTTTGNQILVVSSLTFDTSKITIDVANFQNQTIKIKESANTLDAVVITAGTYEAGESGCLFVRGGEYTVDGDQILDWRLEIANRFYQ